MLAEAAGAYHRQPERPRLVGRSARALGKGHCQRACDLADMGLNVLPDAEEGSALLCVRAAAELRLGRWSEALGSARRACRLGAERMPEALALAGAAAARLGEHQQAAQDFARACALEPGRGAWLAGLASARLELGDCPGAELAARSALELDERDVDARLVLGRLAMRDGRPEESVAWLNPAARLAPDRADVRTSLAVALVAAGDFAAGLREYEWRQRLPDWNPRPFSIPAWDGGCVAGKRVVLWTEQGLGDSIQFARFVARVAERGAHVVFHGEPRLLRLFRSGPGFHELCSHHAPRPPASVHASLMSLPALLGAQAGIANAPYLHAEPALAQAWRARLRRDGDPAARQARLLCGLAWQGNPGFSDDARRSMALANLLPVLRAFAGRVDFVSLQKGFGQDQLQLLPADAPVEDLGPDLDRGGDGFVDSAAVLTAIDLLITTDTALAHLAGALGRPVWTMLARVPDWRWGVTGSITPWYPSMRLFRQTVAADWTSVVDEVGQALASRVERLGPREVMP